MNYRKDWMNDRQWECYQFLADLMLGFHHIKGIVRECGPRGIEINTTAGGFATFDFDNLTRAVVMAHDRLIRFEIESSGPRMIKLSFHKRDSREGRMYERHPTIEEAIKKIRK